MLLIVSLSIVSFIVSLSIISPNIEPGNPLQILMNVLHKTTSTLFIERETTALYFFPRDPRTLVLGAKPRRQAVPRLWDTFNKPVASRIWPPILYFREDMDDRPRVIYGHDIRLSSLMRISILCSYPLWRHVYHVTFVGSSSYKGPTYRITLGLYLIAHQPRGSSKLWRENQLYTADRVMNVTNQPFLSLNIPTFHKPLQSLNVCDHPFV